MQLKSTLNLKPNCYGFTLLELLTVVSILAIISGVGISSFNSQQGSDAQYKIAEYEMEQLRQSLIRFQEDNLIVPIRSSAADLGFLFDRGSLSEWDIDYQRGWRGPYQVGGDGGFVDVGDNLQLTGVGKPEVIDSAPETLVRAVPDPFRLASVYNDEPGISSPPCVENSSNDQCLFDWRFVGQSDTDSPHELFGRPYLVFDLDDRDKARIISMGSNGIYESASSTCNPSGDDIVKCLYK